MKNYHILLVFVLLTNFILSQEIDLKSGWYYLKPKDSTSKYIDIKDEYSIENCLITIDYVEKIEFIDSETRPFKQIQFVFNEEGKQLWEKQSDIFKEKMAGFIFENQVITTVLITSKIVSGKVSFPSNNPNYKIEELFEKLKKIVEQ